MKKTELLSPAGSMESLVAAIEGGCDAVYLSGTLYGARSYAANFNNEELKEAVQYAHSYGVKVYVTINILIYESEVKNFLKYIEYLQSISVDAVIVQDIGMMDLLHQKYPSLEIHASTQMHIHNLEGVKLLEQVGIARAVLARETPIKLIEKIKRNTNLELEIFVHGALCISYSGQCLMSSLIGGRSGNRGTCAQCCRQPYKLLKNKKILNKEDYLLSTKDLNTLEHLDQLLSIGVNSLKIEGRMKRPEYVYLVTRIYRKAIDSYYETGKVMIDYQELEELKKLFNRKFTKGFIFNEDNDKFTNSYRPNHLGIKLGNVIRSTDKLITIKLSANLNVQDGIRVLMPKEDFGLTVLKIYKNGKSVEQAKIGDIVDIATTKKVLPHSEVLKTSDYLQLKSIQNIIKEKRRKVLVDVDIAIKKGTNINLSITDGINDVRISSDYVVEESKNAAVTKETITTQLSRLGNTVFQINKLNIILDDNVFVPTKVLNDLRRDAISKLVQLRDYQLNITTGEYHRTVKNYENSQQKSILINSINQYENIKNENYDVIYMEEDLYNEIEDNRKVLKIPRVLEHHKDYEQKLLVGELGSVNKYRDIVTDFSLNIVNSYSVAFLHSLGVNKVTLSYELNNHQIEKIVKAYECRYNAHPNLEVIVSGRIEAMIMKYKLLSHYQLGNQALLEDKYKNKFTVEEKNNLTYIYHYENLKRDDYLSLYDIGINWLRF